MNLLLDTHVALWAITGDATLGAELLDRLRHDPDIFLSPVSLWEITIKQAAGKLSGPSDLAERVRDMGFGELPVTHIHAIAAGRLPPLHRDPFDRILVAQAAIEGMTLASRDSSMALYDVDLLKVCDRPVPHTTEPQSAVSVPPQRATPAQAADRAAIRDCPLRPSLICRRARGALLTCCFGRRVVPRREEPCAVTSGAVLSGEGCVRRGCGTSSAATVGPVVAARWRSG